MLTVNAPTVIINSHLYRQDSASTQQAYKINYVNLVNSIPAFPKPNGSSCSNIFHSSSFSWMCEKQHKSVHSIFHHKCLVIDTSILYLLWSI